MAPFHNLYRNIWGGYIPEKQYVPRNYLRAVPRASEPAPVAGELPHAPEGMTQPSLGHSHRLLIARDDAIAPPRSARYSNTPEATYAYRGSRQSHRRPARISPARPPDAPGSPDARFCYRSYQGYVMRSYLVAGCIPGIYPALAGVRRSRHHEPGGGHMDR